MTPEIQDAQVGNPTLSDADTTPNDTRVDVEHLITSYWQGEKPGLSMPNILGIADQQTHTLPPTVQNWLAIYDEVGAWFANLAMLMTCNIMDSATRLPPFESCIACVVGSLSAQIVAIRRLVTSGLDVQAKQLVRVLTEHVDVAIALSIQPELCDKFILTTDERSANEFWHAYVRRGKLRKVVFTNLEQTMELALAKETMEFVDQEEQILGMTIHPSIAAAQMAMLSLTNDSDSALSFGFLGETTIFSERTLSYAAFYLVLYVAVGFAPNERQLDTATPAGQLIGPFQERVLQGRAKLLSLMHSVLTYWHDPALRCDLDSVWNDSPSDGEH